MKGTVAPSPHLRRLGFAVTLVSLAAIARLTLRPVHSSPPDDSHLCLVCGAHGGVDILLNTLLFIPLGVGLHLSDVGLRRTVSFCFALSLSIELAQAFVIPGRDATLSDVITNTIGGAIGFALVNRAAQWITPSRRGAAWLSIGWSAAWLLIQIVSSYSFVPTLPNAQYFGQIARPLGGFARFHGQVASARIDSVPIPNTAFADSRAIRDLLIKGAPIIAAVHAAEPTPRIASIVRVVDDSQREIASIAQDGEQLLFDIRTGASVLRLRQPVFGLGHVFPRTGARSDSSVMNTLISGRYSPRSLQLVAQTPTSRHEMTLVPTSALGWALVLPSQWYIENTLLEHAASFVWVAVLLIPLGYWAAALAGIRSAGRRVLPVVATALGLLCVGLVIVPAAFRLPVASPHNWLAALMGLGVGALLQSSLASSSAQT